MLKIAVLVFAIGAVGGLILANSVLRGRLPSWGLSLLHAALGATGLVLTGLVVLQGSEGGQGMVPLALAILVVAALGGFLLASFHARKQPGPRPVVIVHALVAVTGFLLLCGGVLGLV